MEVPEIEDLDSLYSTHTAVGLFLLSLFLPPPLVLLEIRVDGAQCCDILALGSAPQTLYRSLGSSPSAFLTMCLRGSVRSEQGAPFGTRNWLVMCGRDGARVRAMSCPGDEAAHSK